MLSVVQCERTNSVLDYCYAFYNATTLEPAPWGSPLSLATARGAISSRAGAPPTWPRGACDGSRRLWCSATVLFRHSIVANAPEVLPSLSWGGGRASAVARSSASRSPRARRWRPSWPRRAAAPPSSATRLPAPCHTPSLCAPKCLLRAAGGWGEVSAPRHDALRPLLARRRGGHHIHPPQQRCLRRGARGHTLPKECVPTRSGAPDGAGGLSHVRG